MTKKKYLSLFIILVITFTASIIGGFTTALFKEPWYSQIILPSFVPRYFRSCMDNFVCFDVTSSLVFVDEEF